jgi:hypothetical protein
MASLLLKLIRGEFGDLVDHTKKKLVNTEPTLRYEFIHLGIFGVVKVGEDRGLVTSFGEMVHEFGIGFGSGGDAAEGGIFRHGKVPLI